MKSNLQAIEDLIKMPIYSIQSTSFLGELSEDQKQIFITSLVRVANSISLIDRRRITITFRGDSNRNLSYKLSSTNEPLSEDMMFDLYFYFGDKAKHFYARNNDAVNNSLVMKCIEDYCKATFEFIYDEISKALRSQDREIIDFMVTNTEFACFFNGKNKDIFIDCMSRLPKYGRDYYFYFLHTAGWKPFSEMSFLVSTSRNYDAAATTFGLGGEKQYITYYLVPEPFENFAVSHTKTKKYESMLRDSGMPLYNGKTIYPNEQEIAIKGALLPNFILGVRDVTENRFIANPHLFTTINRKRSITSGLYIDQSDFMSRLCLTNYKSGTKTYLDGWYRTIHKIHP